MARVAREVARSGKPFKTVVNDAIRQGLDPTARPEPAPFRVEPWSMGVRDEVDVDDIWGLIHRLDGPRGR